MSFLFVLLLAVLRARYCVIHDTHVQYTAVYVYRWATPHEYISVLTLVIVFDLFARCARKKNEEYCCCCSTEVRDSTLRSSRHKPAATTAATACQRAQSRQSFQSRGVQQQLLQQQWQKQQWQQTLFFLRMLHEYSVFRLGRRWFVWTKCLSVATTECRSTAASSREFYNSTINNNIILILIVPICYYSRNDRIYLVCHIPQ